MSNIVQVTIEKQIEEAFTYHAPDTQDIIAYGNLRSKAKELALLIISECPACADRTAAIRKLRECIMTANAAIALKGAV